MMQASELDSITWRLMTPLRALESSFLAWSRGETTEEAVSDQYVRLGNEYISAKNRLAQGGIAVHDLIDVPQQLRVILEDALAQDCSPDVVAQFDPMIREVMKQLFHQLKDIQLRLPGPPQAVAAPAQHQHQRRRSSADQQVGLGHVGGADAQAVPAQKSAVNRVPVTQAQAPQGSHSQRGMHFQRSRTFSNQSQQAQANKSAPHAHAQHQQQSQSHHQSNMLQHQPAQSPQQSLQQPQHTPHSYSHSHSHSHPQHPHHHPVSAAAAARAPPGNLPQDAHSQRSLHDLASETSPLPVGGVTPPPMAAPKPPQSKEEDAITLLQRHGALERQASKRYSTRQISRMINGSAAEMVSLPTSGIHRTFNTPEFKESSVVHKENNVVRPDTRFVSGGTAEQGDDAPPITPEQSVRRKASMTSARMSRKDTLQNADRRPSIEEVPSQSRSSPDSGDANNRSDAQASAAASGGPDSSRGEEYLDVKHPHPHDNRSMSALAPSTPKIISRRSISASGVTMNLIPASPARSVIDEEFPVFLKAGSGSIRKAMLTKPPSIAAIRLRFVEVCAYIHSGDETFPEIMLQDPKSGINYEVTEATVTDVTEGSLLTLKVKTTEELSMESELKEIKATLKELGAKITQNSAPGISRGSNTTKPASFGSAGSPYSAPLSKFPSPVLTGEGKFKLEKPPPPPREIPIDKVERVSREIAVIRQLGTRTISGLRAEIDKLKSELKELSTAAPQAYVSDRRSMNLIKEKMDNSSQELLSKMENLSDIIDAQRLGIGSHGVRYPQNELDKVRRQLAAWSSEFERSEEFIQSEKPVWKKTWQAELNNVIEDQEWLKSLDLLYADLRSDLEQSVKTFELVCEANSLPRKAGLSKNLPIAPPIKPGEEQAVADAVFDEISALNFNHEQRAEAVQRAERLHRARLALRSEEFEDELNSFVSDAKLKPNGGFEEVERRMREREEAARKLGEQSEAEAREKNKKLREERKAKREAKSTASSSETWHDAPSTQDELSQKSEPHKLNDEERSTADLPTSEPASASAEVSTETAAANAAAAVAPGATAASPAKEAEHEAGPVSFDQTKD